MGYGKIIKKKISMRTDCIGEASARGSDGKEYTFVIGTVRPIHAPYVTCLETGETFVLPWDDILNLAEEAGILQQ